MDLVLEFADSYVLDYVYSSCFPASLSEKIPSYLSKSINSTANLQSLSNHLSSYQTSIPDALQSTDVYGYLPTFFPTSVYTTASLLPRFNIIRQTISLFVIMTIFGELLYLGVASLSYLYVFDKQIFNHPRYLKNQMSLEIKQATTAIPVMVMFTIPWFLVELRGYSKLYWDVSEETGGWAALLYQYPAFIMFTDFGIYLIHRALHWPKLYKWFHKPHHKWLVTTPYASHAFHPFDGYAQSLPYHIYPFLFPLHKLNYLILFTFVNFWTVMIHDGEYLSRDPVINGAACHTIHHLYFNYNYGQFTTLWDRIGKSYREPDAELFDKSKKQDKMTWEVQISKMEEIKKVVEAGVKDDRIYGTEEKLNKKNN